MAASAEDTAALLGRVPVFEALRRRATWRAWPTSRSRAASAAGEVVFREGDDSDTCYVVRSGHARAVREHARRAPDHARHVRPGRHLRRAGDVRRRAPLGHRRGGRRARACSAILGVDMRAPAAPAPRHRGQARDRARPAPARGQRAARPPVLPDRAEPRRRRARASSSSRRARRARPTRDVLVTATQAELAQLAGSSRESASRFLAVLERAGVITQGRGRLTVHDPAALAAAMSTERRDRDGVEISFGGRRGPRATTCS